MYSKKIAYTDFDGNQREETFYFNITEAELTEMECSVSGGFRKRLERIMETKDEPEVIEILKSFILQAYGEKSNDGKYFKKEDSVRGKYSDDFKATEAYSALFMELGTDADKAAAFINGILPAKIREELAKNQNTPKFE